MPIFLAILAMLVAVNVWATRRVLASPDEFGVPKRILIAGVWIIPFLGAFIAKTHTPLIASNTASRQRPSSGTAPAPVEAPEVIDGPEATRFDVRANLAWAGAVPVLDWAALGAWSDAQASPESAAVALDQGRRAWLLHFRDALGEHAHLHQSADAYVLSTLDPPTTEATAKYVTTAKRRAARVLGDLARFPAAQRSILVVLDSNEDYDHYVSVYYPSEGEFAFSGGMFIDAGCPHFVVVRADLAAIEPVIAHELTHAALAHFRLPRWLDEGLAVNAEHKIAGARRLLHTPHELHRMHRGFWNDERIQQFWSGASFDRSDDGNPLSYELARIIVGQLGQEWDRFARFVAAAQRDDGGAAAARETLGVDLGAYAAALLEVQDAGVWSPNPRAWLAAE